MYKHQINGNGFLKVVTTLSKTAYSLTKKEPENVENSSFIYHQKPPIFISFVDL
jgi:hypothetical protein